MTIAIHQPNYFPWLGFFFKLHFCDVFVFHDVVALSRRTYARRTRILKDKGREDTRWLTVPLLHHASDTPMCRIEVDHGQDWQQAHLNKIANAYRGSRYFDQVFPWIQEVLEGTREHGLLTEINRSIVLKVAELLELEATYRESSEISTDSKGAQLNIELVRALGGETYLSGIGARQYQSKDQFVAAGIELVYHDFGSWVGTQTDLHGEQMWLRQLSVIHALMRVGKSGIRDMFERYAAELAVDKSSTS